MGCIFSMEVDVPDEVLPAPDPSAGHTFFCKNISMMSKDYVVWQGGCGEDEGGKLWMVVDQEGKWWDGNMVTTLETFRRDSSNPDLKGKDGKIGSGETVVSCIMDKLDSDNYIFGDYEAHVDSDDSDYTTMSDWGEEDVDVETRKEKCKWKAQTSVQFYSGREYVDGKPRPCGTHIATLKIKAKGKAKQKSTVVEIEMEDGSKRKEYHSDSKKKVKKFVYKLTFHDGTADGQDVPIQLIGNWNHGDGALTWQCPGFAAKVGGFFRPKPTVDVAPGTGHPGLWLLIGFMASINLSPDDVLEHCHPPFKGYAGLDP